MRRLRLLALTVVLPALTRCGQPESSSVSGEPFFSATVDGSPWVASASSGTVLSSGPQTLISAIRLVSPQATEEIQLTLAGLPAQGRFTLGGPLGPRGYFRASVMSGTSPPVTYFSSDARPGVLTIDGVSSSQGLVAGTFAFEASLTPDTSAHRVVNGQFLVRYSP